MASPLPRASASASTHFTQPCRRHIRDAAARVRSGLRASTTTSVKAISAPCIIILCDDEDALDATSSVVEDALDGGVRVVPVLHDAADGLSRGGREIACEKRALKKGGRSAFALHGASGEDAAVICCDPTGGLCAKFLGLEPVLCVVGISRETALGEDGNGSRCVRAGRRASVTGVPTVVASVPTTSATAPIEPCAEALGALMCTIKLEGVVPLDRASNCPRSHFPFPTRGRWASLGSAQLPMDDELAASVLSTSANDFADADCWSLGGAGVVSHTTSDGTAKSSLSPDERRRTLREAFREADVMLQLSVPSRAKWSGKFATTKPGVLWRQERVTAIYHDGDGAEDQSGASKPDVFGRSLPSQKLDGVDRADESGARFVRQLATEKLIADRHVTDDDADDETHPLPRAFTISTGVVVADESPRGDIDAVSRGAAAVSTLSVWPESHPFALLDDVLVESLRDDPRSGLPRWIIAGD